MAILRHRLQILNQFLLVPYVVAGGQDMSAQIEEFVRDRWSNPEAPRRILRIYDNQIYAVGFNQVPQMLAHYPPPRTAKNIAYKKNAQVTYRSNPGVVSINSCNIRPISDRSMASPLHPAYLPPPEPRFCNKHGC